MDYIVVLARTLSLVEAATPNATTDLLPLGLLALVLIGGMLMPALATAAAAGRPVLIRLARIALWEIIKMLLWRLIARLLP
jgi:hypothetical protein